MANAQYPVVDITDTSLVNSKRLLEVIRRHGFAYISVEKSPFQNETILKQFALASQVFQLETSVKQCFESDDRSRGWVGAFHESLDVSKPDREHKEAFNIGELDNHGNPQQNLPGVLKANIGQLRQFEAQARATCYRVLIMLARGLEIKEGSNWLVQQHGRPSCSITRLLRYPAVDEDNKNPEKPIIRAGAHSDWGSLSLLFQRRQQSGLQVSNGDSWSSVPVCPEGWSSFGLPPIVVIPGEWMGLWTGGLLQDTIHRVALPSDYKGGQERNSIVHFCQPRDDVGVRVINSPLVDDHLRHTRAQTNDGQDPQSKLASLEGITSGDLFLRRLNDSRA